MSEDALFKALSTSNQIPWDKAAEHFMYMKIASGGLYVDEIDQLKEAAAGLAPEDVQRALDQGTISGIRSSVSQDITNKAKHQRTHGERVGKGVGSIAGLAGGVLAGRGGHTAGEKAFRAAVGLIGGHEAGKVIGQELDAHKLNKRGSMEKDSGVLSSVGGWALKNPRMAMGAAGAGLGALAGAAGTAGDPNASMLGGAAKGALVGGGLGLAGSHFGMKAMANKGMSAGMKLPGGKSLTLAPSMAAGKLNPGLKMASMNKLKQAMIKEGWSLRNLFRAAPDIIPPGDVGEAALSGGLQEGPSGAINEAAGQVGGLAGHALGEKLHYPALGAMAGNLGAKGIAGQLTEGMDAPKTAAANKLLSVIRAFKKTAEEPRGGLSTTDEDAPVGPNEASGNQYPPTHDEMGAAPDAAPVVNVDQDLQPDPSDAIMELLQRGNESEFHAARADEAQQAASTAEERASMLESQMQQLLQEIDQVKQESGGQAQQASEQAMMASQDAMSARTESQAAQQQMMMLRQSITSYRQQLMDMLAQDPTAAAGPPQVPVGPPPGPAGMAGPTGGPGDMGQPMPAGPMGPEGGAGPEGQPQEAAPPAAAEGAPKTETPKAPKAEAPPSSGVNVNIHAPKAAKPASKE
ncbi:hypothetical protein UFOVP276_48 [uncultured Caudovirales phage]|uniref:Uncharacterized protein n=1 Tax=uncultured Caudovirales phage TaxID=2100421 RepID=A0A6J5LP32_9CAUD|nr:hypothetical protein UFOVP127_185 [uncultured Caudovirales phage]CAB4135023.1 hypothetical protein UFOVP276_48 [uncultured Caudovirales phage]